MFAILVAPLAVFKLWYWVALVVAIAVILGIIELIALKKTDKTISNQFVDFVKANKRKSYWVLAALTISYLMLIAHLWLFLP
jgi:hypothetical protein